MINAKNKYLCTMLAMLTYSINMCPKPGPHPQAIPAKASSTPSEPKDFNAFLFTVATGVTVVLVSKGCEYLMHRTSGSKEAQEQELKLQQERVIQQRMLLIHEFCKDEKHKELCQQLKQQYLESQLALNAK